jgi:hypothetical protein
MKTIWLQACCLTLVATAGLAQAPAPSAAPVDLAAILGISPPVACPEPSPRLDAVDAARKPGWLKNTCTALCASGTVTCTGSGTCTAVDRACPNERGHVICDGVTTFCPTACPICTEGSTRLVPFGCCSDGTRQRAQQQCINGTWQTVGFFCSDVLCRPTPL